MPWHISTLAIFIIFFIQGCTIVQLPQKSSHEKETLLALEALDYQYRGEAKEALSLYETLYKMTKKEEYLKTALKLAYRSQLPMDRLLELANKDFPNDDEIKQLYAGALLNEGKIEEAKEIMLELVKHEKSVQNLSILASIYFYQKDYAMSLKYYDAVYKKANDEASLLMIVELLDNHLNKTNEAISYLETHSRMQGCTKAVCYKLIQIYGKNKNIKGLISVYRRLYEKFGQKEDASKVVELLIYDNNQKEAIEFLKKSKHDPDTLIQLYASKKEFAKAYDTAKEIYEEAGDLHYLGLMAVYEYEGAKKKDSKALLDSVSKKFERVVQKSKDPLFLNYYGYLLIDHSLDIKKGISLVQKALIYEPQSPYYIDSLAWGYYKLNECKKALETIEPIIDKTNEPEVLEHYELILDCIRKKRDTR